MKKNELNLIHAFIDKKHPKSDLEFAHLLDDGIYATDTRKAIFFNIPMLQLDLLLDKKILKGFISLLDKDSDVTIDGFGFMRSGNRKLNCDTFAVEDYKKVEFKKLFTHDYLKRFSLESIDDIHFELAQRNCFVDDVHLMPIIQFAECIKFDIFYNEQDDENTGEVKIVGLYNTEDEIGLVKFTAVIIGRKFESQAI